MIIEHQHKFHWRSNWRPVLSALAVGLGIIGLASPAEAVSKITPQGSSLFSDNSIGAIFQETDSQVDFQLAQVGVRSRINAPTSLNITPPRGTHIPLPASNYHRREAYRNYHHPRYNSYYGRSEPCYNRRHAHRRKYRKGSRIIIINPPTYNRYSNSSSYIRVIRK